MTQNKHVNLLLEVLGCFVSAAGIYSFAVASGVPVTGVAGVCAILYRLFGIPMGLSNVLINIPVILFSYKVLGKSFLLRSMRCMVLFAVFTDYLLPMMPVYTGDRLLATLCGGVIFRGIRPGIRMLRRHLRHWRCTNLHAELQHRRYRLYHDGR